MSSPISDDAVKTRLHVHNTVIRALQSLHEHRYVGRNKPQSFAIKLAAREAAQKRIDQVMNRVIVLARDENFLL